jgi:hypothetical protein
MMAERITRQDPQDLELTLRTIASIEEIIATMRTAPKVERGNRYADAMESKLENSIEEYNNGGIRNFASLRQAALMQLAVDLKMHEEFNRLHAMQMV